MSTPDAADERLNEILADAVDKGWIITTRPDPWTTAPPVTFADIMSLADDIEAAEQVRVERWATQWRGRLDGATLNDVMRLRQRNELPHRVHIAAGPACRDRLRRRARLQDTLARRLPDDSRWVLTGSALRHALDAVDVIEDDALGDRWEVRTGRPLDDGEVIATGRELA